MRRGETPRYDNRCQHLQPEEVKDKLANKTPHVIRLKVQASTVVFLFLHYSLEAYSKWVEILHGQLFSCMHMCKTRQTEVEVGRQYQGLDRPGVWQVPEGRGELGKWRKLVSKSSVCPNDPRD